ncbi:MAG: hypothetical protein RDU25_05370 [Patescibacteria group bacterium]|nr:hypothetical protein [Patescibacteria group bacterium]
MGSVSFSTIISYPTRRTTTRPGINSCTTTTMILTGAGDYALREGQFTGIDELEG